MRKLILLIVILATIKSFAQVDFEIINLAGDTSLTIKQIETLANDQQNVNHWPGTYDSLELVRKSFVEIFNLEVAAANAYADFKRTKTAARDLRGLIESFYDTLYFTATQSKVANSFLQKTQQPNFLIRVNSDFKRYKGFIGSNDLFSLELQKYSEENKRWENANPRKKAGLVFLSNKSFRILPLEQTGETIDFYLVPFSSGNTKAVYQGEKEDGTVVRITHFIKN